MIQQVLPLFPDRAHYVNANESGLDAPTWLLQQWAVARQMVATSTQDSLLVVDEIEKIVDWTRFVKRLWDEDSWRKCPVKVIILSAQPV